MCATALLAAAVASGSVAPSSGDEPSQGRGAAAHWTPARMAAAIPRDLVIDERGLGYLRLPDGSLEPHGHNVAAEHAPLRATSTGSPAAAPSGSGSTDTTPPTIGAIVPAAGATIGATQVFSAVVTDDGSGVRSVSFVLTFPGGSQTQSYSATRNGDVWSVSFSGFTDGAWSWQVIAKDNGRRGGNTATSAPASFTVDTGGGGGGGGGDVVANAAWTAGGAVQTAVGRIYFEMPANKLKTRWTGYVCSGTVATDATTGRSIIITAAHCVYDDVYKAFARNVLFIPNQDATSGGGTDLNCGNDPLGCWSTGFGVVDSDWTTRKFPDNIPWDYAYYVVDDTGAHSGTGDHTALDSAAGSLPVQFASPTVGNVTHALGYSYSDDPNFMYCAEDMGTEGTDNWWLPSCGLTGGSSGGPWVQPMAEGTGSGPIISVNSWGYTGQPGMAGPKLSGTSASCVFSAAQATTFSSVSDRGVIAPGC